MIDPRTESALRAIRRLLRAAEMSEKRLAAATGLTPSQLVVLQDVARHGETTAGDRGFVVRSRGEKDRRQVWVSITELGKSMLSSAPDMMQDRFQDRFGALPDWEQAMIVAMLERLTGLLNADSIDAAPLIDAGAIDRLGPA